MNDVLTAQIEKWRGKNYDVGISELTYAELIDGAFLNKEAQVIELLDQFYTFPITQRIVKGAGKLGSVYKQEFPSEKGISMGDKIIAATSVIYGCPVMTANAKDFPQPFFHVKNFANITYYKESKGKMIYIALLFPNYEYIKHTFNMRH